MAPLSCRTILLFAFLSLSLVPIARADQQTEPRAATPQERDQFCLQMGKIAESIAHARDAGESRDEMLDFIHKNFHGTVAQVPEALVPAVYDHPEMNPEQAGEAGVKSCHHIVDEPQSPPGKVPPIEGAKPPS